VYSGDDQGRIALQNKFYMETNTYPTQLSVDSDDNINIFMFVETLRDELNYWLSATFHYCEETHHWIDKQGKDSSNKIKILGFNLV